MRGIIVIVTAIILAAIAVTEGNWYGKRGNEVDDVFRRYLENRISSSQDQHGLCQKSLMAIAKIIQNWENSMKSADDTNNAYKKRYIYGTFGIRGQALQSVTSKDGLLRGVILYDFKSNWWLLYPDKAIFAGHMRKPADPYAT